MDTVGMQVPDREHRRVVRLGTAGATVAAVALAALGAGYAIGQEQVSPAPTSTVYVGGGAHTWGDALNESLLLKRQGR